MERREARGYRKPFLRDLELWEAVTDLPKGKRGIKLVQALSLARRWGKAFL